MMYKLTQWGYCTKNEKGLFEVSYTIDSFWRKLLGLKTKFVFTTNSTELKYSVYLSDNCGLYYEWFDEKGDEVTEVKTLTLISDVINNLKENNNDK